MLTSAALPVRRDSETNVLTCADSISREQGTVHASEPAAPRTSEESDQSATEMPAARDIPSSERNALSSVVLPMSPSSTASAFP